MTRKVAPRKDMKMTGCRAKAFVREAFQPKKFYADEMKDGYSLIVEMRDELKKVRDIARNRGQDDSDIVNGIDKAGQLLATFSKKYTGLTLKMLKHVE